MRKATLALAAALVSAVTAPAIAQTYPVRPVTIIVPFAAGGPTDTTARLIGQSLGATLGQQFVIENIAGAGGTTGTARLAKSTPDGYTLQLHHFGITSGPAFYKNPGYDPNASFEFLGLINSGPFVFLTKNGYAAKTPAELFAKLKADGLATRVAHAGVASGSHKCATLLFNALGVKATYVAYRGTGPALNDLVTGQVDFLCDQTTNALPQIEAKTIQAYVVTSLKRNPQLPDLPTADESGLKDFQVTVWHGLYAPKGTPAAIVETLHQALQKAMADKSVTDRFADLGTELFPVEMRTRAAHAEKVKEESKMWKDVVEKIGLPPI